MTTIQTYSSEDSNIVSTCF